MIYFIFDELKLISKSNCNKKSRFNQIQLAFKSKMEWIITSISW